MVVVKLVQMVSTKFGSSQNGCDNWVVELHGSVLFLNHSAIHVGNAGGAGVTGGVTAPPTGTPPAAVAIVVCCWLVSFSASSSTRLQRCAQWLQTKFDRTCWPRHLSVIPMGRNTTREPLE